MAAEAHLPARVARWFAFVIREKASRPEKAKRNKAKSFDKVNKKPGRAFSGSSGRVEVASRLFPRAPQTIREARGISRKFTTGDRLNQNNENTKNT
jgi:hypothetical protein